MKITASGNILHIVQNLHCTRIIYLHILLYVSCNSVLGLRGTGIGDDSMQQLTMGIKNKNSKHLTELDVSSGNMGSVGATWLAGCTSKFH